MKELSLQPNRRIHFPHFDTHYGVKSGNIVVTIEKELEKALDIVKKFSRKRRLSLKTLNPGERYYVGDGIYVRHGKSDGTTHEKRR